MENVRRWGVPFAAVVLAALGLAGISAVARGDESTAAILDALDHDAAHKSATAAIVQQGRDALERATRMRASGDEAHAQLADGLAREEADTARDLVRAIDAERMADEARRSATDAGVVGDRERALLEEGIARNGRLKAELDELAKPPAKDLQTSKLATADAGAAGAAGARPKKGTGPMGGKSDGGAK